MTQDLQPLVERYLAEPTPPNREAVVLAAVPLVHSLIGRLSLPNDPLATREDLENAGLLGLLQALDNYDPTRGLPFVSYTYARVRGALVDYLRKIDVVSQRRRRHIAEAQKAQETLRQMLGEEPDEQDVADYLGLSLDAYHDVLTDAQSRFALSLNDAAHEARPLLETIASEDAGDAHEALERQQLLEYVMALISGLPQRERDIVSLYFYENLTLREIGELLNLTEARISQILGKTMLKLRGLLARESARAA